MKKLISILTIFLIILSGCADLNSPPNPDSNGVSKSLLKLPTPSSSLLSGFTTAQDINGSVGGSINIYHEYYDVNNHLIKIYGTLTIPQGAFSGTKNINIVVSSDFAMVDFFPSPTTFNVPLLLDLTYEGVNLNGIDEEDIDFYYIDGNSVDFIQINKGSKECDSQLGKLSVVNAVVGHFSRFGWGV